MTTFALATCLASLAIFAGFVAIGVKKFGWLPSYSAYSPMWDEAVPIKNMHLWSIVTFIVAFLFFPSLFEQGNGNAWQFLGFFAPLYLMAVAAFPLTKEEPAESEYKKKLRKRNEIIHTVGAILCAVCTLAWIILVRHNYWVVPVMALAAWFAAYQLKAGKERAVFWGEMAMFASIYTTLLIN